MNDPSLGGYVAAEYLRRALRGAIVLFVAVAAVAGVCLAGWMGA